MENIVKIEHLNKSFGRKKVLHDVSFEIKKGHIVGLIGANGAGKTTIMKSILGIISFDGNIFINKVEISEVKHIALKDVGALIEYPGLYPFLTARQQLMLYATGKNKNERKNKVTEIINKFKINSFADRKTKNFSLGMKQKLGVALALLNHPSFVILDEPMNGLDPQATMQLRNLIINEKNNGTTFLISSHILSELQKVADDVLIIDDGKLIKNTTMNSLLELNQHLYSINTENDERARLLIKKEGIRLFDNSKIVFSKNENELNIILKTLIKNKVKILNIYQKTGDLEDSLVDVLKSEDKGKL